MRIIMIATIAALTFAGVASADKSTPIFHQSGPHRYQWDLARKRCHDERGKFVAASFCKTPPTVGGCRDPKTGRNVTCPAALHRDPPSGLPTGRRQ